MIQRKLYTVLRRKYRLHYKCVQKHFLWIYNVYIFIKTGFFLCLFETVKCIYKVLTYLVVSYSLVFSRILNNLLIRTNIQILASRVKKCNISFLNSLLLLLQFHRFHWIYLTCCCVMLLSLRDPPVAFFTNFKDY